MNPRKSMDDEIDRLKEENLRQQRALEELSILNDIATAINSTLSLDHILELILQKCLKHLKVEQGVVMLLDEKQSEKPFQTIVRKGDTVGTRLPYRLDTQLTGWMLKNRKPLWINDFQKDERFQGPAREDISIHSVLLAPLVNKGNMIGFVGIFNKKAKEGFSGDDQRLLSIIAAQSAQVIENARLLEKEQDLRRMQEELRLAYDIQVNLLPAGAPSVRGYEIAGRSIPAKEVGGDYFDFIPLADGCLAFGLGDVSGKGMPAALLMSNLQATIRSQILQNPTTIGCLENSNSLLFHTTSAEKFVTLFFGILDPNHHRLRFCNAGHNYPFLLSEGKEPLRLDTGGIALGCFASFPFREETIALEPGDMVALFSDGITEAVDSREEEFGEERLMTLIRERRSQRAEKIIDGIFEAVRNHAGTRPQMDDMTLVIIKRETG